jgi:hypothetical protein
VLLCCKGLYPAPAAEARDGVLPQIAPTAMLFIPCRKGVSHRPDEYASPADMQRGVQVRQKAVWPAPSWWPLSGVAAHRPLPSCGRAVLCSGLSSLATTIICVTGKRIREES